METSPGRISGPGSNLFKLMKSLMSEESQRRWALVEAELSRFAGVELEVTLRGGADFTISGDGDLQEVMERVRVRFFLSVSKWTVIYDAEFDTTCAYFSALEGGLV